MLLTLANWILAALTLLVADGILSGVSIANFTTALLAALVLGVVNTVIRPILNLLALPINLLTLGLFSLVINGALVLLASAIVPGFVVLNLGWAILLTITLWVLNTLVQTLFPLKPRA